MPWWHSFVDPYEMINVVSHGVPSLLFLACAPLIHRGFLPGGPPLALFCMFSGTTHLLSTLGHLWPDSVALEKLDHFGIVGLIVGTPITSLMALDPPGDVTKVLVILAVLMVSAALGKGKGRLFHCQLVLTPTEDCARGWHVAPHAPIMLPSFCTA